MRDEVATDHAIAAIAERQGRVIDHKQLRELGLSSAGIGRRAQGEGLHQRGCGVGPPTLVVARGRSDCRTRARRGD
jgi:hypothetical protein